MRKLKKICASLVAAGLLTGSIAQAAEGTTDAQEIENLKARLAQLEERLSKYEGKEAESEQKIKEHEEKIEQHTKSLKFHVEGDASAAAEYHSSHASDLSSGNSYTGQVRVRFISGKPTDKIYFYSEATTNFTSGESDHFLSGDSPYFSQAYFTFRDVLGLDSIRIGRSGGDCLGVGGPIDRPTNYDGIKFDKTIGVTNVSAWVGNYTSKSNGDDPNEQNTMVTAQVAFPIGKNVRASVGYWNNPHAFHNKTRGQYINANAGAGYDKQWGLDATLHWKLGGGFQWLTEITRASLNNPTGGLKKNPVGLATMIYWTKAEFRPGLFPNIAEIADWHQPKTFGVGLIYGDNDAAHGPYALYNCSDFSNGSIYGAGNNVRVLMLRGEYVFSEGVLGYVRVARAWIKDKGLLSGQAHLGGDNYFGAGLKLFF